MTPEELRDLTTDSSIFLPPNPLKFNVITKVLIHGQVFLVALEPEQGVLLVIDQPLRWSVYTPGQGIPDNPLPREEFVNFGRDAHQNQLDRSVTLEFLSSAAVTLNAAREMTSKLNQYVPGSIGHCSLQSQINECLMKILFCMLRSTMEKDIIDILN